MVRGDMNHGKKKRELQRTKSVKRLSQKVPAFYWLRQPIFVFETAVHAGQRKSFKTFFDDFFYKIPDEDKK